jgi:hypothetical protein
MSDGTIFQRGPNGELPLGQSINGVQGAYGNIPLHGPGKEHVTMYGSHWHRSWDNPGTTGDHTTLHGSDRASSTRTRDQPEGGRRGGRPPSVSHPQTNKVAQ